jgi:cytoskeletal protein CcmA (bactofilin family)
MYSFSSVLIVLNIVSFSPNVQMGVQVQSDGAKRLIEGPFTVPRDSLFQGDMNARGDVTVDGTVSGDVALKEGMLTVNGKVKRDAVVVRGSFLVTGEIGASFVALGSEGVIKGHVDEDVVVFGGLVQLDSSAVVEGDLVIIMGEVVRQDGSKVKGDVTRVDAGPLNGWLKQLISRFLGPDGVRVRLQHNKPYRFFLVGLSRIISIAFLYLLGFLALVIFKRWQKRSELLVDHNPWKMLLAGVIFKFALAAAFVVLVISLVGLALVPFAVLGMLFIWFLAIPQASLWAGKRLKKLFRMKSSSNFALYSLGFLGIYSLFILSALLLLSGRWANVPSRVFYVLGVLLIFAAMTLGRGGIIYAMFFPKEARSLEAQSGELREKPKG